MGNKVIGGSVFLFLFIMVLSLSGCDQLSSFTEYFKDYFSPKQEQKPQTAAVPQPAVPQPQAAPQKAPQGKPIAPNVLVKIGNWSMTLEEFNERLQNLKQVIPDYDVNAPESQKLVLEELIRQELLFIDAEQSGIAKDKDIVAAVEEFRKTLLVRKVAEKIAEGIEATDEEAKQFYDENKDILIELPELKVREIVAQTQVGANDILIELLKGEKDFAAVAKERSIAKSAAQGGDLGYITEAPFEKMRDVLMSLEVGSTSSVFKGPEGFYIVKLEDKRGGETKPFEEVKEEIKSGLTIRKQQQALVDRIEQVRQKTQIYVNEGLLEAKK